MNRAPPHKWLGKRTHTHTHTIDEKPLGMYITGDDDTRRNEWRCRKRRKSCKEPKLRNTKTRIHMKNFLIVR